MQSPGVVRKNVYCVEKWKFRFLGGWGMDPSSKKVLILVQQPQHKSTSDSVWAPKKEVWRYSYKI